MAKYRVARIRIRVCAPGYRIKIGETGEREETGEEAEDDCFQ
jgi:hypothetical protein